MMLTEKERTKANKCLTRRYKEATKTMVELMSDSDGQIIMAALKPIEKQLLIERMSLAWRDGYLKGWEDK